MVASAGIEGQPGGLVLAGCSKIGSLGAGASYLGTWTDVSQFASLTVVASTTNPATLYVDFSMDAAIADRVHQMSDGASGDMGIHGLPVTMRYVRVRVIDGGAGSAALRVQTLAHGGARVAQIYAAPSESMTPYTSVLNARSVILGASPNNEVYKELTATADGHLEAAIRDPTTAFGEVVTSDIEPRAQIDAILGEIASDIIEETENGGVITYANSMFVCDTGVNVAGEAAVRSRAIVRYRAGQGLRFRFGCRFSTGVPDSLQAVGAFNEGDALWFGYNGDEFGVFLRQAGAQHLHKFNVTVGAGGAEVVTVTLDGTPFTTSFTGAVSAAVTASAIAGSANLPSDWYAESVGATVYFLRKKAGPAEGAYTFASTGTAAGTPVLVTPGAANDHTTPGVAFFPQTQWSVDRCNGQGGVLNRSGFDLDPTMLNTYQIVFPWHGAGTIAFQVYDPREHHFLDVHRIEYGNTAQVPSQKQPIYRIGWLAQNLGNNTSVKIYGTAGVGFIEGLRRALRPPDVFEAAATLPDGVERLVMALRIPRVRNDLVNQAEGLLRRITVLVDEASERRVRVRVYRGGTVTDPVAWNISGDNGVQVATVTPTTNYSLAGARKMESVPVTTSTPLSEDLERYEDRFIPGDTILVTVEALSGAPAIDMSLSVEID